MRHEQAGAFMADAYYKITIEESSESIVQANLSLVRPQPTPFDTETTITAENEDDAWAIAESIDYDFLEENGDEREIDTNGFSVEEVDEV